MEGSHEYLEETKSAELSLLTGIDSYLNVLGSAPNPVLVGKRRRTMLMRSTG